VEKRNELLALQHRWCCHEAAGNESCAMIRCKVEFKSNEFDDFAEVSKENVEAMA
jgi:hypothetical protein